MYSSDMLLRQSCEERKGGCTKGDVKRKSVQGFCGFSFGRSWEFIFACVAPSHERRKKNQPKTSNRHKRTKNKAKKGKKEKRTITPARRPHYPNTHKKKGTNFCINTNFII